MTDPAVDAPVSENTRRLLQVLDHHAIDTVIDIGAHRGEYAQRLRRGGYTGRIVSFEPQSAAHAALDAAAADDPDWEVAPRIALGKSDVPVTLKLSAETDMSSVLDFTKDMTALLDSSAYVGSEVASQARLEAVFPRWVRSGDTVLLKVDTQGTERDVIEGARRILGRVALIQVELSIVPVYRGETGFVDMITWLETLDFAPVLFLPGYFNKRTARLIGMDGVFVRA